MSEENVEIFRRHVAAFNDGDLDAMADLVTEDFEFIPYLAAVVEKTTTYRGRDWLRQYREDAGAAWDDIQVRIDEIRDLGDRAVAFGEIRGRGRGSGAGHPGSARMGGGLSPGQGGADFRAMRTRSKPSKPPGCRSRPGGESDLEAADPRLLAPRCQRRPDLVRHLFASETPKRPETTGSNRIDSCLRAATMRGLTMWIIVFTTVYIL